MARFLDHHPRMASLPPDAAEQGRKMTEQIRKVIQSRKPDQFGVTTQNVYMAGSGEAWCATDAPTAEAVIKSHEALGVRLNRSDITEVTPLG